MQVELINFVSKALIFDTLNEFKFVTANFLNGTT